jgi:ribonuclease P protein component
VKKTFTLKKTERLKSRKSIDQLFNGGKNFFIHPFKVQYTVAAQTTAAEFPLQAGVTVSTRNFKKAVDRNRIKRLTREAYRLQKNTLELKLTQEGKNMRVFFVFVGKEIPLFAVMHEKLHLILERLIQKADEENTANT